MVPVLILSDAKKLLGWGTEIAPREEAAFVTQNVTTKRQNSSNPA